MKNKIVGIIFCMLLILISNSVSGNIIFNENNSEVSSKLSVENDIDWWPMRHHDAQNSGHSSSTAPDSNNIIWNSEIGGSLHTPVLVWNNIVYVNYYGSELPLYCLNATDGSVQWKYSADNWNPGQTPAIADGYLYTSFLYYKMEVNSQEFLCLNATNGHRIWSYIFTDEICGCDCSPTVWNGYVYFGSNNDSLFCFDANPFDDNIDEGIDDPDEASYDLIWLFDSGGDIQHTPAIYNGKIYVVSRRCAGGDLFCLNATTGEEIWHKYCGDVTTSTVIYNGRIYYGAIGGSNLNNAYSSHVFCIDADNPSKIYWEYVIDIYVIYATPAVAYGKVFFGLDNGHMYCLDAIDGSLIWDKQTDCKWMGATPAVADYKLYTVSGLSVMCLDCDNGNILWENKIKRVDVPYVYVSPVIAKDTVFVGVVERSSSKSCVYAFADGIGVKEIIGGRLGPTVVVQNTCDVDLNVNILMKFEIISGFIFAGKEIQTSVGPLKAGLTFPLKRKAFGFGHMRIKVYVNSAQTGYGSTKTVEALVWGLNTIIQPD